MRSFLALLGAVIILAFVALAVGVYRDQARTVTNLRIAHPVVLLHGLGQKAHVWTDKRIVHRLLESYALGYGGNLIAVAMAGSASCELEVPTGQSTSDVFTLNFSDPGGSVDSWATELKACIDVVVNSTGAKKVTLVAYSMGGLAARRYLVDNLLGHKVHRLVTIATPHKGSELAVVRHMAGVMQDGRRLGAALDRFLDSASAALGGGHYQGFELGSGMAGAFESTLQDLERNFELPLTAPALADLQPEAPGNYVYRLNRSPHPQDVEYISVVGGLGLLSAAPVETVLIEALRQVLAISMARPLSVGDGVVAMDSQDLATTAWFQASFSGAAWTVMLEGSHFDQIFLDRVDDLVFDGVPEVRRVSETGLLERRLFIEVFDQYPGAESVELISPALRRTLPVVGERLVRTDSDLRSELEVLVPADQTDWNAIVVTNRFDSSTLVSRFDVDIGFSVVSGLGALMRRD
ncbi:MAG: esterase/lipase family protein [Pseudomonadota bacterium]